MSESYDLLLADSHDEERRCRASALRAISGVRVREVSEGRAAVTSLSRAAYHAFILTARLRDVGAPPLIRMIRAGLYGHPSLPVIVIADRPEPHAIARTDANTSFVPNGDPEPFAREVIARLRAAQKPTLLLVEDDAVHAEHTSALLSPYYQVEVSHDGVSALGAWRARRHDVVLLDLMLPGLSGEQIQQQIIAEKPDQAIVILTANGEPQKHQEMVLSGAAAFLSKPADIATAALTIDSVLRDQRCAALVTSVQHTDEQLHSFAAHVHAAHYTLARGQASTASHHLERALAAASIRGPSDDEWSALLSEFAPPP